MPSKTIIISLLLLTIIYWAYDSISNADRKYSSVSYWQTATLNNVMDVPDGALFEGNKHGSVLMFASAASTNTKIIQALIERGCDVNEVDPKFNGTPLSAAATKNSNPDIIHLLVKNGAKVNITLSQGRTPVINAARKNTNSGIISALIKHGANINTKDDIGLTAMDYAKKLNNTVAIRELSQ